MKYAAPSAELRDAFHQGTSFQAYQMLGAHPVEQDGVPMWHFCVWAPNAKRVSLVGEFCFWDREACPMEKQYDGTWEIRLPASTFEVASDPERFSYEGAAEKLKTYKFAVLGADDQWHDRADPYSFMMQQRPNNASCMYDLDDYEWHDQAWIKRRSKWNPYTSPVNIYEVHLGSWKRVGSLKSGDGHSGSVAGTAGRMMTYQEISEQLIPYVQDMGYTHIELLPVMEHPLDMSWGYQVTGYYAATSRYGTPKDLMALIDKCHAAGIGVILDWVPAHFPRDEVGLRRFDGTPCYEHADPRRGEMPQWGTCMFDMARGEVRSFLKSNASFWLKYFHADGIRVDAVSSIVYHDFCRAEGEWLPNKYGGRENLEGISFLQELNENLKIMYPGTMMIAEESHAFPGVTHPASENGLAFTFKWNMGWMNDILAYVKKDPVYRKWHHDKLTFSLFYAFSEHFVLPFSHDEVVHGKGSMVDKQPGDLWKKFAGLRALYGYMLCHPGKKLLFMGGEFAQFIEWRFDDQLDWFLLLYDKHPQMQHCVRTMNRLYTSTPALYEVDDSWDGFRWINANDQENSVTSFMRIDRKGNRYVCVTNWTPVYREQYRLGMPDPGVLEEILNTDREEFGGSDQKNPLPIKIREEGCLEFPYSVDISLPPLATVIFKYRVRKKKKKAEQPKDA